MYPIARYAALALAIFASNAGLTYAAASPQVWNADPRHSSAQFTITHLGISHVRGIIPIVSATIDTAGTSPLPTSVNATLDATGVNTQVEMRDNDLKSAHFFDVAQYPKIVFTSTSVSPIDGKTCTVAGNLTMHGVTKPVVLKTTYLGQMTDPKGAIHAGYEASTTIKRSDFGMTNFSVVVGDDVDIDIDIEAIGK